MTVLPTLFASQQQGDLPLHEQLVRTLREAILAGHLPLHSRLPASRLLARDLGISRSTVELAYGRLEAEGYLVRKVGAGSFVALAAVRGCIRCRWMKRGSTLMGIILHHASSTAPRHTSIPLASP